jgi:hypothetical protein
MKNLAATNFGFRLRFEDNIHSEKVRNFVQRVRRMGSFYHFEHSSLPRPYSQLRSLLSEFTSPSGANDGSCDGSPNTG